jgi:hypothetical protein
MDNNIGPFQPLPALFSWDAYVGLPRIARGRPWKHTLDGPIFHTLRFGEGFTATKTQEERIESWKERERDFEMEFAAQKLYPHFEKHHQRAQEGGNGNRKRRVAGARD